MGLQVLPGGVTGLQTGSPLNREQDYRFSLGQGTRLQVLPGGGRNRIGGSPMGEATGLEVLSRGKEWDCRFSPGEGTGLQVLPGGGGRITGSPLGREQN